MAQIVPPPKKFLELRAHVVGPGDLPQALAMCANYDGGRWRAQELAEHLCRWLPEWALRYGERPTTGTMMEMARRAALKVYATDAYESRGEFGELMLHAVIRHEFGTDVAVSKIFFKDRANDTVKGFDCVHISRAKDRLLDLWLGEAKFYTRRSEAIASAAEELRQHLERDYLREEFAFVVDKLERDFPYTEEIRQLLDGEKPLDQIVSRIHVPVLLAYDGRLIGEHREVGPEFAEAMRAEAEAVRTALLARIGTEPLPQTVVIDVIVLPVEDKQQLAELLHKELRQWQGRT
jgi:Cap4 SAVED domain